MLFLYSLGIRFYHLLIHIASPFNSSAKKWITGRNGLFDKLERFKPEKGKTIWIHCASLGEFEQARPLIEKLKTENGAKIVLSFFSPSGYDIRKDYKEADLVTYLPIDFKSNAIRFLDLIKPDVVIFVKYEFWFNFINETGKRKIPLYLVSGIFRKDHFLFSGIGKGLLSYFDSFTHFFLQDEYSAKLLRENGFKNVTVSGDTRFDRVLSIAAQVKDFPVVKEFASDSGVLVAGSTWEPDEDLLLHIYDSGFFKEHDMKLIIAPHHVTPDVIARLKLKFTDSSKYSEGKSSGRVMIIDNIGMLSSLYRYGTVAYVGGGFGKAVHNVLEPAAFGIPVIFGPENEKFREIQLMKKENLGFEIRSHEEMLKILHSFLSMDYSEDFAKRMNQFMIKNSGAVEVICKEIKQKITS